MTPDLFSGNTVLNLGCGRKRMSDAVNVDVTTATNPDIVHNLNDRPWPLPANHFHIVHANDVIEHLDDTVATMEEIYRICAPGAVVNIIVPHFSAAGAYTDPTHRHYFGAFTFNYFAETHELNFYSHCRFNPLAVKIFFHPTLLNKLVWRLANRHPEAYERSWAWIFPAWFIHAQLEVIKLI